MTLLSHLGDSRSSLARNHYAQGDKVDIFVQKIEITLG